MFNHSLYNSNVGVELTDEELKMAKFKNYLNHQLYSAIQTKFSKPNRYTKKIVWDLVYLHDDPSQDTLTVRHTREIVSNSIKHRSNLKPFGLAKTNSADKPWSRCNKEVFIQRPTSYRSDGTAIYISNKPQHLRSTTRKPGKYKLPSRTVTRLQNKQSICSAAGQSMVERMAQRMRKTENLKTIFIRNLPLNADKDDITDIGSDVGTVTRVSMIHSKEEPFDFIGRAFVVYSTPQEAAAALEYWSNLDIDARSIEASLAKPRKKKA